MIKITHTRFLDKAYDVCCCPEHHSHYGMPHWMQTVYATDCHSTVSLVHPQTSTHVTIAAQYVFTNKLIGTSHDKMCD